ncbi:hypothetical protein DSM03_102193 [Leeuwenhoekiella aestuarii]|uniref:MG2 domain-containing protein n=1 Tax=Leeuwenhoekiella aestuarii TaxID=2249426 RepID=A0A4Q0NVG6_9FLAO|nr:hypothetical protein [Leeuwenhoekiella aestuarii]RXG15574.1 hypothetical protein DSM04_103463 [Leeuwenhoekiella aestuarii]RXG17317.1 hypothetical protein DSM03_102193 [Leeuwenhoekiella aestuarii]
MQEYLQNYKCKPIRTLLGFLLVLVPFFSFYAQEETAREALAEKVYLQLDKQTYAQGETLWFKALVTQAKDNKPSPLSAVLHVELVDVNDKIIVEKQIQIKNGVGDNFIDLEKIYPEGNYQLRAYTQWNRNFGEWFMFKTYISIIEYSKQQTEDIFNVINPEQVAAGENLKLVLNPKRLDSSVTDKVNLSIALDGKINTYTVKKNEAGIFLFEEKLPVTANWAKLLLETESGQRSVKYFNWAKPDIDLQFFPEGGHLIAGMNNQLGFKAIDQMGKGIALSGEVLDEEGGIVAKFKSNKLGMGRFFLIPKSSTSYTARITKVESSFDTKILFNLPQVETQGTKLSLNSLRGNLLLSTESTKIHNDTVYVEVSSRGISIGRIPQILSNGKATTPVTQHTLPNGIIAFKLLNKKNEPLAERLFYNENNQSLIPVNLSLDKAVFETQEQAKLNIDLGEKSRDTIASASLLVVANRKESPELNLKENIESYLLLSSELKGKIENPTWYFSDKNKNRLADLEALMLTQGWSKYNFSTNSSDDFDYEPELSLNVAGDVAALFSKEKMKENVFVSLMTFAEGQQIFEQQTDSLGRFYFSLPPYTGTKIRAVLQTKNEAGRQRDYTLNLAQQDQPEVEFPNHFKSSFIDRETAKKVLENAQVIYKENLYEYDSSITALDTVMIDNYEMTPKRKEVADLYGKPDTVVSGEKIRENEPEWSFGLYSILRQKFGDELKFYRVSDDTGNYLKAYVFVNEETLVLVDGSPIRDYEYFLLQTLPTSDIKSVELIKNTASNYSQLYLASHPFLSASAPIPISGSILSIYTIGGGGILTAYKAKGILKTTIPVFSRKKEFYEPKYKLDNAAVELKEDNRETIVWRPNLNLNTGGKTILSFYNRDLKGDFSIIVEVLSKDGKIGFEKLRYQVE